MYTVLVAFCDLEDGRHVYKAGDTYPREGYDPEKGRIEALSTKKNRRGVPLIKSDRGRKRDRNGV